MTKKSTVFISILLVSLLLPCGVLASKKNIAIVTFTPPVIDFVKRVTKKPFGIFVTPTNSPIKPERFTGYHTGADAEFVDTNNTIVPVVAIAKGTVLFSGNVKGYGGLIAIAHTVNGKRVIALYGHLKPASLLSRGKTVTQGQRIGILGKGFSNETDGERKHLHFAILATSSLDVRGYVQKKSDLSHWINPLTLFSQ